MSRYGAAPIVDIVSFGYRKLFEHLWPLTRLSWPFFVTSGILMGLGNAEQLQLSQANTAHHHMTMAQALQSLSFVGYAFFAVFLMYYFVYVMMRYARDVFKDTLDPKPIQYLMPDRTLWGLIRMKLLLGAAMFPAIIIILIGLLLLILPGLAAIAALIYGSFRLAMASMDYMMAPEKGIIEAFKHSWFLTQDNVLRIIGTLFISGFIQAIVMAPFSGLNAILGMVSGFVTIDPILLRSLLIILNIGLYWSQFVVGGGGIFVLYRLWFDLSARLAEQAIEGPSV